MLDGTYHVYLIWVVSKKINLRRVRFYQGIRYSAYALLVLDNSLSNYRWKDRACREAENCQSRHYYHL